MTRALLTLVVLFALGCGGKLEDGDGGTSPDGSSPHPDGSTSSDVGTTTDAVVTVDVSTGCTTPMKDTITGMGSCQVSESWSCGATAYSVQCDCPSAMCSCSEMMGGMGSGTVMKAPSVCPTCTGALAALCGFPQ